MRSRVVAAIGFALALPPCASVVLAANVAATQGITAEGLLKDTRALSDDAMEGRGPGTAGDKKARAYLIDRLKAIGFKPGGPGGSWEQPFPIVGLTVTPPPTWTFHDASGHDASFAWRDEFIGASGVEDPHVAIDGAEVVFVGYGIQAPEFKWDDFKKTDLKGKILVMLNNDPDWDPALFGGPKRLYYGRWDYKFESAARQGAAAAIIVHTEASAGYGWNVVQSSWSGTQFELPGGTEPRVKFRSWMTEAAIRKLAALGGKNFDDLLAASRKRDFKPISLGVTTSIAFDVAVQQSTTANVVGILPGSDPALAGEVMIFSAHHDHLGIGQPDAKADKIYNGALDNASGCAQVLAIAQAFTSNPKPTKRTIMALFVGGEEQGLLGSRYYVAHPTFPLAKIAANINIDGGNIWGRTEDVAVIGKGKSDLEDLLAEAAKQQWRYLVDEPEPDKGYYYRSDQLSFARAGVPALYFKSGQMFNNRPAGWGKAQEADYRQHRYHQPSDIVTSDWNMEGMVQDDKLAYMVGLYVADGAKLPAWYKGDEFEAVRKKTLADAAKAQPASQPSAAKP